MLQHRKQGSTGPGVESRPGPAASMAPPPVPQGQGQREAVGSDIQGGTRGWRFHLQGMVPHVQLEGDETISSLDALSKLQQPWLPFAHPRGVAWAVFPRPVTRVAVRAGVDKWQRMRPREQLGAWARREGIRDDEVVMPIAPGDATQAVPLYVVGVAGLVQCAGLLPVPECVEMLTPLLTDLVTVADPMVPLKVFLAEGEGEAAEVHYVGRINDGHMDVEGAAPTDTEKLDQLVWSLDEAGGVCTHPKPRRVLLHCYGSEEGSEAAEEDVAAAVAPFAKVHHACMRANVYTATAAQAFRDALAAAKKLSEQDCLKLGQALEGLEVPQGRLEEAPVPGLGYGTRLTPATALRRAGAAAGEPAGGAEAEPGAVEQQAAGTAPPGEAHTLAAVMGAPDNALDYEEEDAEEALGGVEGLQDGAQELPAHGADEPYGDEFNLEWEPSTEVRDASCDRDGITMDRNHGGVQRAMERWDSFIRWPRGDHRLTFMADWESAVEDMGRVLRLLRNTRLSQEAPGWTVPRESGGWYVLATQVACAPAPTQVQLAAQVAHEHVSGTGLWPMAVDAVGLLAVMEHNWAQARGMLERRQAWDKLAIASRPEMVGYAPGSDGGESDEEVQDWALQQALLHVRAGDAQNATAAEVQEGTVLDVGLRSSTSAVQVLVREDGARDGRDTLVRWKSWGALQEAERAQLSAYLASNKLPLEEGEVQAALHDVGTRELGQHVWARRLQCHQHTDPSLTLGTRVFYAEPVENLPPDHYEVERIHSHKGDGAERVYVVSWKGISDAEVLAEDPRGLEVKAADMGDGGLLQAYLTRIAEAPGAAVEVPRGSNPGDHAALEAARRLLEDEMKALQLEVEKAQAARKAEAEAAAEAEKGWAARQQALEARVRAAEAAAGGQEGAGPGGADDLAGFLEDDPLEQWLLGEDTAVDCTVCAGILAAGAHTAATCPGAKGMTPAQHRHALVARAALKAVGKARAEELLRQVPKQGPRHYPVKLLTEDEAAAVKAAAKQGQALQQAASHPLVSAGVPQGEGVTSLVWQVQQQQQLLQQQMQELRAQASSPQSEVARLRDELAASRKEARALHAQVTAATNESAGVSDGRAAKGFMDDFAHENGWSQGDHAMMKLKVGGENFTDTRIMLCTAAALHGYSIKCQELLTRGGTRRIGMDIPVEQFLPSNTVKFSTNKESLWQKEVRAVEKVDDGTVGLQIVDGKLRSGKSVVRTLVAQPKASGWDECSNIDAWVQGMAMCEDELEHVDAAHQHCYNDVHTLPALMRQHRRSMRKCVYDKYFAGLADVAAAFPHFLALEVKLRQKMMEDKPETWEFDPAGPYVVLVRDYVTKAERARRQGLPRGGGPPDVSDQGYDRPGGRTPLPAPRAPGTGDKPQGHSRAAQKSFATFTEFVAAYSSVRSRKGHEYCLKHAYSGECDSERVSADGARPVMCSDGRGGSRVHLCVRCGGDHDIEGKGACSKKHIR